MKRILCSLLACICCCLYAPAYAATGDVIGTIYPTDIKAYINGVEVPSYNIGGRTAVVIEDILSFPYDYNYNDYYRTLKVFGLEPESLRGGTSSADASGYIYETDIKTTIYDVEIPSYNIGGRTAVVIEDLGRDGTFSEIGGRYFWDAADRTISLEFLYSDGTDTVILSETETEVTYTVSEDFKEIRAVFQDDPLSSGSSIHYNWPEGTYPSESWEAMKLVIPVTAVFGTGDEGVNEIKVIGYYFQHPSVDYGFTAFTCVYEDLYRAAAEAAPDAQVTREEVINYFITNKLYNVLEQFDTDAYSFVYMQAGGLPHGTVLQALLLINADGSYHNFAEEFESVSVNGTKVFEDVRIDRENQKVYLHYDTDYVIDLQTGTMQKVE